MIILCSQYGAFLAVVAVLQLTIGASIYAYRSSLNEMFDNALNESMAKDYGPNYPQITPTDTLQSAVSCFFHHPNELSMIFLVCSSIVVEVVVTPIGPI